MAIRRIRTTNGILSATPSRVSALSTIILFSVAALAPLFAESSFQTHLPWLASSARAAPVTPCRIFDGVNNDVTAKLDDVLARALALAAPAGIDCPRDILSFRALLEAKGLTIHTSMVANRGFHNPSAGSFSFFEWVTGKVPDAHLESKEGQFFFGHFTGATPSGGLTLETTPSKGALLIELIAWNEKERQFHFYELIGDGKQGSWIHRGTSSDIQADTKDLHRARPPAAPVFGKNLRCSGCHVGGGPILKEATAPHNDWWRTGRPLPLGGLKPDPSVSRLMARLEDASALARNVTLGNDQLGAPGTAYAKTLASRTLQERLRPLFCAEEVNFESDSLPLSAPAATIEIPAAAFVSPFLATAPVGGLKAGKAGYLAQLTALGVAFPESGGPDADHAWLAPVKAAADTSAIKQLLRDGLVDEEFVADVLAVDVADPALSSARCSLLKFVPSAPTLNWKTKLEDALAVATDNTSSSGAEVDLAAQEFLANLSSPARDAAFHRATAANFITACGKRFATTGVTRDDLAILFARRNSIATSEISKNPRGQILEPGFRVIFPEAKAPLGTKASAYDAECAPR